MLSTYQMVFGSILGFIALVYAFLVLRDLLSSKIPKWQEWLVFLVLILVTLLVLDFHRIKIIHVPTPAGGLQIEKSKQLRQGAKIGYYDFIFETFFSPKSIAKSLSTIPQLVLMEIKYYHAQGKTDEVEKRCSFLKSYGVPKTHEKMVDNEVVKSACTPFLTANLSDLVRSGYFYDSTPTIERLERLVSAKDKQDAISSLIESLKRQEKSLRIVSYYYSLMATLHLAHSATADDADQAKKSREAAYAFILDGLNPKNHPTAFNLHRSKGLYFVSLIKYEDAIAPLLEASVEASKRLAVLEEYRRNLPEEDYRELENRYNKVWIVTQNDAIYYAALSDRLNRLNVNNPTDYIEDFYKKARSLDKPYKFADTYGYALAVASAKLDCPERDRKISDAITVLTNALESAQENQDTDALPYIYRSLRFATELRCD